MYGISKYKFFKETVSLFHNTAEDNLISYVFPSLTVEVYKNYL